MGKSIFLREHSQFSNLLNTYKKYGKLIIAVDFDDTIRDYITGEINWDICNLIKRWVPHAEIIIWSCRTEEDYDFIWSVCAEAGFVPNRINEQSPISGYDSRKVFANVILDDKAGLKEVYNTLTELIDYIDGGRIENG